MTGQGRTIVRDLVLFFLRVGWGRDVLYILMRRFHSFFSLKSVRGSASAFSPFGVAGVAGGGGVGGVGAPHAGGRKLT